MYVFVIFSWLTHSAGQSRNFCSLTDFFFNLTTLREREIRLAKVMSFHVGVLFHVCPCFKYYWYLTLLIIYVKWRGVRMYCGMTAFVATHWPYLSLLLRCLFPWIRILYLGSYLSNCATAPHLKNRAFPKTLNYISWTSNKKDTVYL